MYGEWYAFVPSGFDVAAGRAAAWNEHCLNSGLTWLANEDLQWDIRVGFGLNDAAEDLYVGAGGGVPSTLIAPSPPQIRSSRPGRTGIRPRFATRGRASARERLAPEADRLTTHGFRTMPRTILDEVRSTNEGLVRKAEPSGLCFFNIGACL